MIGISKLIPQRKGEGDVSSEGLTSGKADMGALEFWAGGSRLTSFVYQPTRCGTSSYLHTFTCCNTSVAQSWVQN